MTQNSVVELTRLQTRRAQLMEEQRLRVDVPREIEEEKALIAHLETVAEFDAAQAAFVPSDPDSRLCAIGWHRMRDTRDPRYVKGVHFRCTRCGREGFDNGDMAGY